MKRSLRSSLPAILVLLVGMLGTLALGIYLGGHPEHLPGSIRDALVGDKDTAVLREGIDLIKHDYYRKVNEGELANSGLAGVVRALNDRFSHYYDPRQFKLFQQDTAGKFGGIGVTVHQDKRGLELTKVDPGSPAGQAGLRVGDVVVAVGSQSLRGKPDGYSTGLIRGAVGTTVALTVSSRGRTLHKRLTRASISAPIVSSRMLRAGKAKVAYVSMRQFTSGVHGLVGDALRARIAKGARGIVFDLRSNGGGLVTEAQLTASLFLPQGQVVVSTGGRTRARRVLRSLGGAVSTTIPMVVLVDQDSASATEIVTGALQDHHRATVVGTHTFGKGVFQEVRQLSNGAALELVAGEYFTPDGHNVGGGGVKEGKGLTPDVQAPGDRHTKADDTLQAGLRVLAARLR